MTHRDLRRLINTIRRLQHNASRAGHMRIGVRLNAAGDALINEPKGVPIGVHDNAREAAMRLLEAPVKEGEE